MPLKSVLNSWVYIITKICPFVHKNFLLINLFNEKYLKLYCMLFCLLKIDCIAFNGVFSWWFRVVIMNLTYYTCIIVSIVGVKGIVNITSPKNGVGSFLLPIQFICPSFSPSCHIVLLFFCVLTAHLHPAI